MTPRIIGALLCSQQEGRCLEEYLQGDCSSMLFLMRCPRQSSFRPGHSTEDLIFVIRQLFEKVKEKNTTLYATFVDFRKAFDSVDRGLLWLVLLKMLAALRNLHQGKEGYVQYTNESFGRFLIRTGV